MSTVLCAACGLGVFTGPQWPPYRELRRDEIEGWPEYDETTMSEATTKPYGLDPASPRAFLWHDGCWELFQEHFEKGEIDLHRLYAVCQLWTPRFGYLSIEVHYPGIESYGPPRLYKKPAEPDATSIIGDAETYLEPIPQPEHHPEPHSNPHAEPHAKPRDVFSSLPLEIREQIACFLPTPRFLALRLASRPMALIFYSQTFWRSRFTLGNDRGCLRYLLKQRTTKTDWLLLYHCTNDIDYRVDFKDAFAPALITRLTIHVNSELIRDQCLMRMSRDMQVEENRPTKRRGLLWTKAFGRFRFAIGPKPAYTPQGLCEEAEIHSTAFYTQTARVSTHWIGLGVYVQVDPFNPYDADITGLELICKGHEHPNRLIGYELPGGISRQEILEIHLPTFTGFQVLGDLGQIRAIRALHDTGKSRWIGWTRGEVGDVVKGNSNVLYIKAYFHRGKLIDLALGSEDNLNHTPSQDESQAPQDSRMISMSKSSSDRHGRYRRSKSC